MVKKFYSNLVFDNDKLRAMTMIQGQKIELAMDFPVEVIGCHNEWVERYYNHSEVPFEGYSREKAMRELMIGLGLEELDLQNIGFKLSSKGWIRVEEPDFD